ncbi:hypothetical protein C8Q76DRAFT_65506 [Earliella scabrosa]|nr:hypothetical protein C8Q76DRAFT_65506 [Earliella scabrosa]
MQSLTSRKTDQWNILHPPFETLPACYLPSPDNDPVPTFAYGLAFTTSEGVAFATKHHLIHCPEIDKRGVMRVHATVDHIARVVGLTGAKVIIPFADEYEWVLQVFTNHTYRSDSCALEKLVERLPRAAELLGNGQKPLWWWSTEGGRSPNGRDSWPSSWDDADHVAPEFRALIPEDIWERWRERRRKEDEEERARAAEDRKLQDENDGNESDEDGSDEDGSDEDGSSDEDSESDGDDRDL